ncbi:MAG: hypothetical protein ACYS47_16000 [Planctomycetota bacterium]|jgi:hypothetical protein
MKPILWFLTASGLALLFLLGSCGGGASWEDREVLRELQKDPAPASKTTSPAESAPADTPKKEEGKKVPEGEGKEGS